MRGDWIVDKKREKKAALHLLHLPSQRRLRGLLLGALRGHAPKAADCAGWPESPVALLGEALPLLPRPLEVLGEGVGHGLEAALRLQPGVERAEVNPPQRPDARHPRRWLARRCGGTWIFRRGSRTAAVIVNGDSGGNGGGLESKKQNQPKTSWWSTT